MFKIFGRLWYVDNKDVLEELKVTDGLCDELLKSLTLSIRVILSSVYGLKNS